MTEQDMVTVFGVDKGGKDNSTKLDFSPITPWVTGWFLAIYLI